VIHSPIVKLAPTVNNIMKRMELSSPKKNIRNKNKLKRTMSASGRLENKAFIRRRKVQSTVNLLENFNELAT